VAADCTQRARRKKSRPSRSLMDVAIYCHRFANLLIALHATDGNRNIVDHAEAFAVIGKRVMESSSDADGHAVDEGMIGGQHRSASGEPEGAYQLRRVRTSSSNSSRALSVPVLNFST